MLLRRGWGQINKFNGPLLGVSVVLASTEKTQREKNTAEVNVANKQHTETWRLMKINMSKGVEAGEEAFCLVRSCWASLFISAALCTNHLRPLLLPLGSAGRPQEPNTN